MNIRPLISVAAVVLMFVTLTGHGKDAGRHAYSVQQVTLGNDHEYRLFHRGHHFMTVIYQSSGAVALRPRPGLDVNGWGPTLYPQVSSTSGELTHGAVDAIQARDDSVRIKLSGLVPKGTSDTYGEWTLSLDVRYLSGKKKIIGSGKYTIILDAPVSAETGDLNLYRFATNYLDDVPLLGGGIGDTGDMMRARIVGGTAQQRDFKFDWIPPDLPAHYPTDTTDRLSINVKGQYNNVDTAAQGYEPIDAAYKPSVKVTLASRETGAGITFGARYETAYAQDFWQDNVGITPLIRVGNPRTEFRFKVKLLSKPLPGDGASRAP